MKTPFLLGRLVFGGFFLWSGIDHFRQKKELAQYAASKNVPLPDMAVAATGAMMIAGGTSVLLGIKPKFGTLALIGFLAGVSPAMHDFWKVEDPEKRASELAHFTKNMALLGAATTLMAMEEPWPVSVPIGQPSLLDRVRRFTREIAA